MSGQQATIRRVTARITALRPEEGGSAHPFYTGYRPLMRYRGAAPDAYHAVEVAPHDGEVHPGQTAMCDILFFHPEYHQGWVATDASFELLDGPQIRACGVIDAIDEEETDGSGDSAQRGPR